MIDLARRLSDGWKNKVRRILPPVISSFLCFAFVVIKPLSNLGGEYAFLCYTALLLFCFPGGTIGGQIEATILGILFSAAGLGWSAATLAIAAYCGRTYGADCAEARAIIGVGLASLAFLGELRATGLAANIQAGFIRSYSPRLTLASRIGLFFPVFLLTDNQDITRIRANDFLPLVYITFFAAAFGLVPICVIARKSSGPALGAAILGTLSTINALLPISIATYLDDEHADDEGQFGTHPTAHDKEGCTTQSSPRVRHGTLGKALKFKAAKIGPAYRAYSNEITHSRLDSSHLQPIITALKAVTRNPLLGSSSHTPGERIQAALLRVGKHTSYPSSGIGTPRRGVSTSASRARASASTSGDGGVFAHELESRLNAIPTYLRAEAGLQPFHPHQPVPAQGTPDSILADRWNELSRCISVAVQSVGNLLVDVWGWDLTPSDLRQAKSTPTIRLDLSNSILAFETDLERALDPEEGYSRALSGSRTPLRSADWRTSLIAHGDKDNFRLAFYMVSLLDLGRDSLSLLDVAVQVANGAPVGKRWHVPYIPKWIRFTSNTKPIDVLGGENIAGNDAETEEHPADPTDNLDFIQAALRREHHAQFTAGGRMDRLRLLWRGIWDSHKSLQIRIGLSRFLHFSKHSRHTPFAFKLTLGISLLSLPALLPPGSPGRVWFEDVRGGWMVASYLYVLEVHTGAIFRVGVFRITGTFVGAVAAYVCSLIAQDNPYALVTLATLCSIPISYIILFTTFPGVGTVAGITLPPLLFLNYLDLSMGRDAFFLAWTRFVNITIGIIAAVLVGSLVYPDHARVRYFSAVSIALERLTEYYLQLSRDNLRSTLVYRTDRKIYSTLESSVRREIAAARTLVAVQRNEISLLPRPTKLYAEVLDAADRLIDTLIEIRLLRFSVPRKETVLDVLPLRNEIVSATLVNLWACSQAFRSRSPLPQFLPNPRTALEELLITVDEHKREGRRRSRGGARQPSADRASDQGASGRGRGERDHLAMLYAMAEHEALGELCNLIDELVAAARTLFGSQTYLDTAIRNQPSPDD